MATSKKFLTLVKDEILLTDSETKVVTTVKDFAVAILERDGSLVVTPANAKGPRDDVVYSGVVVLPDLPIGCENLAYLGMDNQIVFVSLTEFNAVYWLEASTSEVVAHGVEKFGLNKRLPHQDVLVLNFRNHSNTVIYAAPSDCAVFNDVLTNRKFEIRSNGMFVPPTVKDAETGVPVTTIAVTPTEACALLNMAKNNGGKVTTLYNIPPRFRN